MGKGGERKKGVGDENPPRRSDRRVWDALRGGLGAPNTPQVDLTCKPLSIFLNGIIFVKFV